MKWKKVPGCESWRLNRKNLVAEVFAWGTYGEFIADVTVFGDSVSCGGNRPSYSAASEFFTDHKAAQRWAEKQIPRLRKLVAEDEKGGA